MTVMAKSMADLTSAMKDFVEEGRKERASNAELLRDLTSDRNNKHELSDSDHGEDYDDDDENTPPPPKKIALEASDAEGDVLDDIDGLLEAGEIKDSDNVDLSFLDTLAQDFEVEDKVGADVTPKVATIVTSSFTKKLSQDKIKVLQDEYLRPNNCAVLAPVKVNPEIWAKLLPMTKAKDLEMQKTQMKLGKAVAALSTVANNLLSDRSRFLKHLYSIMNYPI